MKRVAVHNMGCRLNIHEGETLKELLKEEYQLVPWEAEADYYVLNTCSVTARADQRARGHIRAAHRRAPDAKILVTGCYAQTRPEALAAMPEVSLVVGNADKESRVAALLERLEAGLPVERVAVDNIWAERTLDVPLVDAAPGLSRPFVKIQDGCNEVCSFCKIPLARGRNRSLPSPRVLEQVLRFAASGYREVVFTGVHMGCWGEDLEPAATLRTLLAEVLAAAPELRVRLSSIEPNHFTDELLDFLASPAAARVQPHLHLPLQSGSDRVLERMRRRYRAADYRRKVAAIAARIPDVCLGADVMVGFPGETDSDFEETATLVSGTPLAYLHVFPYSAREKTPAARAPDPVDDATKARRGAVLRELSDKKWRAFVRSQVGRSHEAIALGDGETALTGNYIETRMKPGTGLIRGELVTLRLTEVTSDGALGDLLADAGTPEARNPGDGQGS